MERVDCLCSSLLTQANFWVVLVYQDYHVGRSEPYRPLQPPAQAHSVLNLAAADCHAFLSCSSTTHPLFTPRHTPFHANAFRDLAKNWDVDIATELEDYLGELEEIQVSFDQGETNLNFAEAALLIQGSACVYSRKVEYLYTLIFNSLAIVSKKKRERQKSSVGADGIDVDALFSSEATLLPLDNHLLESKTIDILEKSRNYRAERKKTLVQRLPSSLLTRQGDEGGEFKVNNLLVHSSGGTNSNRPFAAFGLMIFSINFFVFSFVTGRYKCPATRNLSSMPHFADPSSKRKLAFWVAFGNCSIKCYQSSLGPSGSGCNSGSHCHERGLQRLGRRGCGRSR